MLFSGYKGPDHSLRELKGRGNERGVSKTDRKKLLWGISISIAAVAAVIAVISLHARGERFGEIRSGIEEALDTLPKEYKDVLAADHELLEAAEAAGKSKDNAVAESVDEAEKEPAGRSAGGAGVPVDPTQKLVALTFDDGPSMYTEEILDLLTSNDSRATFFMVGYNIEKHPERVKMVLDAGCEVGNHTSGHKDLSDISRSAIESEVYDNERLLNEAGAEGELLLRPPYGLTNDTVKEVVKRPMINWSVDSRDWKTKDAASTVAEVKKNVRDGRVVLMHDIYKSTVEAVKELIPWLKEQGYRLVTVSELYEARGEELKDGHVYSAAEYADNMKNTSRIP